MGKVCETGSLIGMAAYKFQGHPSSHRHPEPRAPSMFGFRVAELMDFQRHGVFGVFGVRVGKPDAGLPRLKAKQQLD